jgi:predicted regulator of Ras-like GTPase activity (Roadblock/LC7/MglB family)
VARTDMIILEPDLVQFQSLLDEVRDGTHAAFSILLDTTGQRIAASGKLDGLDQTSMASLAAGNVSATEGLADLVGENGFVSLHHEGADRSIYVSLVSSKVILLVVFDEQSSLGLVRLRVQHATPALAETVDRVMQRTAGKRAEATPRGLPVNEISDADIDALFG